VGYSGMPCFAVGAMVEFWTFPVLGHRGPDQESDAMGNSSSGTESSSRPLEDRLDSWKEIAAYLNRDVTTVQRWEKREGMPVHRHLHGTMGSVYASRVELDAWAHSRNPRPAPEDGNHVPSPNPAASPPRSAILTFLTRWTLVLPLAAGAALAIGATLW